MTRNVVPNRVIVRGAGEMASGVIRRLFMAGFEVIALEKPTPDCVRRYVCFAEAFFKGKVTVEGVTALLVDSAEKAIATASNRYVPVLIDPEARQVPVLAPMAVVDSRMLKQKVDNGLGMAPVVIGLGPGFVAGENCHAAVETERGIDLGRVIYNGSPRADSGVPASVNGYTHQRVVRSPVDGKFTSCCKITDIVESGQVLGRVAGVSVVSRINGMVRGIVHDGLNVSTGQKIGDVDPRCLQELCYKISDRANAVGGGVLEALLALKARHTHQSTCSTSLHRLQHQDR
ncbi:MAG: selenium-dependent molybdenum cofactor biosynthesis protein YqeB [Candidatus Zixiibacteriota bacterium]